MTYRQTHQHLYKHNSYDEDVCISDSVSDESSDSDDYGRLPRFQSNNRSGERRRDKRSLRTKPVITRHLRTLDCNSLSTISSNISSPFETTNDTNEDDISKLYTPIERRMKRSPSRGHVKGIIMTEELSPVLPERIDDVPMLQLQGNWRPRHTSTTTSFQPFISTLPKTNPHHGPKAVNSTPRASIRRRIPMHSYNQVIDEAKRPQSYSDFSDCDHYAPVRSNSELLKPTFYRPENFGLPVAVAKNIGSEGILFLSMTLCGSRLNVHVKEGVYFQDPYQPQISSYVKIEMKRRHTSSRKRQHREKTQSHRTRCWFSNNRPIYDETFPFFVTENNRYRDQLTISVYEMKAENYQRKRMVGCMTFSVKRLIKKAEDLNDRHYIDGKAVDDVVVDEGGFFLLRPSPTKGERQNFPQRKINVRTFYDDQVFSGNTITTSSSSLALSFPSKMRMDNHDWHSSIHGYSSSASDVRILVNSHHLDYTTASSSTNNSHEYCRMHRATLPSITTSENTSNFDDLNSVSPLEPRTIDYHHLYADSNHNEEKSTSSPKVQSSVRRAASFTFSPKGTLDKHNKRPQHICDKEEDHKKKFFAPISKTLSYLRNKIASTSSLYIAKDEVRLWESSFDALLSHKYGCELFRQFLKKEFSSENLEFWLECEELKKMKDGKKATVQKAHEIFREFVSERSVREVNLDSDTRAATKAALENGCKTDTFSLAQSRIQQLMEKDTYRRFLKDRLYLDLVDSYEVPDNVSKAGEK